MPAIARVESGRPDPRTGVVQPWPWTINAEGVGRFFDTKEQAIAAVLALQARGVRSIDVGCMQVNLLHHPFAFSSLEEAFDPLSNALYAGRFLAALYGQLASWPVAAAAYHSQTPELGAEYRRRVMIAWGRPEAIATNDLGVAPGQIGCLWGFRSPANGLPCFRGAGASLWRFRAGLPAAQLPSPACSRCSRPGFYRQEEPSRQPALARSGRMGDAGREIAQFGRIEIRDGGEVDITLPPRDHVEALPHLGVDRPVRAGRRPGE